MIERSFNSAVGFIRAIAHDLRAIHSFMRDENRYYLEHYKDEIFMADLRVQQTGNKQVGLGVMVDIGDSRTQELRIQYDLTDQRQLGMWRSTGIVIREALRIGDPQRIAEVQQQLVAVARGQDDERRRVDEVRRHASL